MNHFVHCCSLSTSNKITLKKCQSASQTCDFDAKNAKFFWGGGTALSPDPSPSGEGDTPSPTPRCLRRLDLNPSHSENLPTLLVISIRGNRSDNRFEIISKFLSNIYITRAAIYSTSWFKIGGAESHTHTHTHIFIFQKAVLSFLLNLSYNLSLRELSALAAASFIANFGPDWLLLFKVHKFDQLILKKIIKIVATRCQILMLKCTQIDFGWGYAPDPTGGVTALPQTP